MSDDASTARSLPLVDVGGQEPAPPPPTPTVPECHDDVCITCSDEAVDVTVLELLDDGMARVDTGVSHEEVDVSLLEDVGVGDAILVHAKVAIGRSL